MARRARPESPGPGLSIDYTTTNVLALLVAAPSGAERLIDLRQAAQDANARLTPFSERQAAVTEMHERKNRLLRLTGSRQGGNFELGLQDGRVVAAQRLLDDEKTVQRLDRLDVERSPVYVAASRLARRAETEIRDKPVGTVWKDYDALALPKNDLTEAIKRQRAAIADKKSEIDRQQGAPVTRAYAKRLAREQVEQRVRRPDLAGLKHGRGIVWPSQRLNVEMHNATGGAIGFSAADDGLGILLFANGEAILKRIDAEIDKMIGANEGMTPDEREVVLSRFGGELTDLERVDAELTWRLIAEGSNISHREDVAISALLGITLVTEVAQPSRSSPTMAFDVVGR